MRFRAFFGCGTALVGLSLILSGCNQSASSAGKSTAQAERPKPKPLKFEVKVDAPPDLPVEPASSEVASKTDSPADPGAESRTKAELPFNDPQAVELTLPQVVLSQEHAQTCRVGIGGTLPDFQLEDLQGTPQSLSKLMGSKLTVVVFWNSAQPSALQELTDLGPDVADRFSSHGVAVVGVSVGDDPQSARELAKTSNAHFPILSDPQGSAFGEVATGKIPRTYLVDATGKIAWLDIEYSRTTRRELTQAIRFLLSHAPSGQAPSP
jgi:peroxiredoxin